MRLQQYSAFMRIVEHESEVKVFTMLPNQQKVNLFKMDPSNIKLFHSSLFLVTFL